MMSAVLGMLGAGCNRRRILGRTMVVVCLHCIQNWIALCTEVRFHSWNRRRAGKGALRHKETHALQPQSRRFRRPGVRVLVSGGVVGRLAEKMATAKEAHMSARSR